MPLALLAVASSLDADKYEVIIIDGRLEDDPHFTVLLETSDAICLGITVLTGAPIIDALEISVKVKAAFPGVKIVWGGWHPSLFPVPVLEQSPADIVVRGQGEITFNEVLQSIADQTSLHHIKGISFKEGKEIYSNPDRHFTDINNFPEVNYTMIDFTQYRLLSKRNQLDYISSQGCRFRCHFCADPTVYNRGWYGYSPERIGNELAKWHHEFHFDHVHFQDETFFTSSKRVSAIAEEFLKRELNISWFATMRADQGSRFDNEIFSLCKRAGLERVMIGVEAGSQDMLDWMQKDIKIEQVYETAEKCRQHHIAINFSMIVGFPDESEASINETLRVSKELRKMHPEFRVSIFYFKPYPGNPIADRLNKNNYRFPQSLSEWAKFDFVGPVKNEWISEEQYRKIEAFKFYQRLAWSKKRWLLTPLQRVAKWRCETSNYFLPAEKYFFERINPAPQLS